jgi:DNA-binding transcriptional LysR family regulator
LRGHDLIQYEASLSGVPGARWLATHADAVNVVLRGNSVAAVADAAALGFGLAALPCFVGDRNPALRRLCPEPIGAADIMLVVHPDLARVARVRATMDFIVELFVRDAAIFNGNGV